MNIRVVANLIVTLTSQDGLDSPTYTGNKIIRCNLFKAALNWSKVQCLVQGKKCSVLPEKTSRL